MNRDLIRVTTYPTVAVGVLTADADGDGDADVDGDADADNPGVGDWVAAPLVPGSAAVQAAIVAATTTVTDHGTAVVRRLMDL